MRHPALTTKDRRGRMWIAVGHWWESLPTTYRVQLVRALAAYFTVILCVVGFNWLLANAGRPQTVAPASASRWLLAGLNRVEVSEWGDFRWTDGNSQVCVTDVGTAQRSLVTVRLSGAYARGLGVETVMLQAGVAEPIQVPLGADLRRYTLLTGADHQSGADVCVTIQSVAVRDPNNPRWLGVPFHGLSVLPLTAAGRVIPAPSGLLVGLALAVGWLALLHLSGVPLLLATGLVVAIGSLITYTLVGGLTPFGAGTLRWALPMVVGVWSGVIGLAVAHRFPLRRPWLAELTVILFWSGALLSAFWLLQQISGHSGVWPLKSRIDPSPTWWVIVPIGCAILWFALGWRWLARPLQPVPVVIYTFIGALVLPVMFDIAVHGPDAPIALFRDSPYEYLRDTPYVAGDPIGFMTNFETIAPMLSVHGSTHPPGAILFLWLIEQVFGPGPVATSWLTIGLTALMPLVAVWLGWRLGGGQLALAAGIVAVVMPGQMVYGVTSLDGVFSLLIAVGAAAFFLALEPPYRLWLAVVAGLSIAAALFMTYATTQLFFFGVAAAAFALARHRQIYGWRMTLLMIVRQGAVAAGVVVVIYLMIFLMTGFNVISAARTATQINGEMMERFREYGPPPTPFLPPSYDYYLRFAAANLVSYLVFLTPWILAALSALYLRARAEHWQPMWAALLGSLGAFVLGMWLSGLFNREVERIWMFTYPLAAVVTAYYLMNGTIDRRRLIVYVGLTLTFFVIIKLTLYTIW
ncbi:MAG: hypothetical protein KatS3mg055_2575 [Chloroflexus sp.]|uniref:hypothetical protein n=1 Tax=Chloroflexus sp. TaxID=1904827 RepID=UPI0021DF03F0|nr:hypothetical protein [Chloroflexus sp.]GIV90057.1 MAG: hypothetical protein KatS3mg055_2575 [Chloroflexus sp.]